MTPNAGGFGMFPPGMFGAFGAPPAPEPTSFDALSRQYWSQWGDWMRSAGGQAPAATTPSFDDALGWWARMAQGAQPKPQMGDALGRWNVQARDWMARMQQVASQFAGREATAAEIANAWRSAMGMAFDPMQQPFGGVDVQRWMQQAAPFMTQWQDAARDMTQVPAFGFAREHTQRWQRLTQAQLDFHTDSAPYFGLMSQALQDAFTRFEERLGERSEPGKQLTSGRALFDLWIDAAEDAYAEVALSPEFREAYGKHVNAQMRVKAAMQQEVEHATGAVGMPTRTEIDSAHRKIVQLEREVRRLRDALDEHRDAFERSGGFKPASAQAAPEGTPPPNDDRAMERADPTPKRASNALKKEAAPAAAKPAPAPRKGKR